jgi:hypothetical protein
VAAERNFTTRHDDIATECKPDRGCPRGVLSPLLWRQVVNNLSLDLQKGFHVYGCVNDIATTVSGYFLTSLRDITDSALKITQRWCKTKGLTVLLPR